MDDTCQLFFVIIQLLERYFTVFEDTDVPAEIKMLKHVWQESLKTFKSCLCECE